MCGLVGFVSRKRFAVLRAGLAEATASLAHRGPDDEGLFFSEPAGVGLGHRRLAVIDLSPDGRQPMASENGRLRLVYNGEIYNFRDIRKELESYGHSFRTGSDTEVLLKAYQQWGPECLKRLVGMFALALWDSRDGSLFLARDRLGIKPLYYCRHDGDFLFASELKALMAFEGFPREVDPVSLALYLHYQYVPAPRTIFRSTYKLQPGCWARLDRRGLRMERYWQIPEGGEAWSGKSMSGSEALEELGFLLGRAVAQRLVSDVPLGALLSGGVDSSLVVALMQQSASTPVRTFSIGFRAPGYDEAPWAARVARHLGTEHTEFYVAPEEALEVIPRLPEIYDEPFADSSAIPTFLVSRLARTQVTVALSGDGGDEQFCGYVRYWSGQALERALGWLPQPGRRAGARVLATLPSRVLERLYRPFRERLPQRFRVENFSDKWQKLLTALQGGSDQDLYRASVSVWSAAEVEALSGVPPPACGFEQAFDKASGWPALARYMYVDQHTYLPDAMLTKVDRASMAVGLEVRVPLLDHRVVEFSSRLPPGLKYHGGRGKLPLRKLLGRHLPQPLFERPKMGFGVPIESWLRGPLRDLMQGYLDPGRLQQEGRFDRRVIERTVQEHLSGRRNHQHRLWALLMWEMWRERWL